MLVRGGCQALPAGGYATMKRRVVVCLVNRWYSSGDAALRALLSRRLLVTSRHVILKLGPYS